MDREIGSVFGVKFMQTICKLGAWVSLKYTRIWQESSDSV